MGRGQKLDSHISALNNKRITKLLNKIDDVAIAAASTKKFSTVKHYFDLCEQLYINVKDILPEEIVAQTNEDGDLTGGLERTRRDYYRRLDRVEEKQSQRGMKSLRYLLRKTRRFNSDIISGLQQKQFLYRQSAPKKRLNDIDFHEDNVFNTKPTQKREDEEENNG